MEKQKNDEIEIDLRQVLSVVISKLAIIIIVGVIFGLATFVYTKFFVRPIYVSQASLYVLNKQNTNSTTTYSDLQTSTQLTQDYMVLVKSRTVLEKVISELGINMSYGELYQMITVTNKTNTRILDISVAGHDQYQVKEIAEKVAVVSGDSICSIMQIEKCEVFDHAVVPTAPSAPNVMRNVLIVGMLGVILTIAIVVVRFLLNDTITTSEDVERYLGLSTLALIPFSDELDDGQDAARSKKKRKKKKSSSSSGSRSSSRTELSSQAKRVSSTPSRSSVSGQTTSAGRTVQSQTTMAGRTVAGQTTPAGRTVTQGQTTPAGRTVAGQTTPAGRTIQSQTTPAGSVKKPITRPPSLNVSRVKEDK